MQANKIKIGISAIIYPLFMGRYMWEALEDRGDCELYVVGPYTGARIPWGGGMSLQEKYVKKPYLALPATMNPCPYEFIQNKMPDDLDLFLSIDAGWHFTTRPKAKVVALIKTDPHAIMDSHYSVPARYSDVVFNMQTPYIRQGEKYLPYAFSMKHHYPVERKKIHDACLVGLLYEHRADWIRGLRSRGVKTFYDIGLVFDEYREVYNASKIALSWSSLLDLPARVWEAFGMAIPLVTNRLPDLNTFFVEDDHYLGFNTVDEGIEKVLWALEHPLEVKSMADAAYRKVIGGHTWDHRMTQVLEACKII